MRLDTAASISTRRSELLAQAHAARLAGTAPLSLGRLVRRTGTQIATAMGDVRAARVAPQPVASAARS
jgi:hypothetical protein